MKKLIRGIIEFRQNVVEGYRDTFAKLALGQSPDTLFIACSDSRVVPNLFASTNPGDLFVIRNVGNLVAPFHDYCAEGAAIEFSVLNLKISDIVVCGHSECGAMQALCGGREKVGHEHLREWLRHGDASFEKLKLSMPKSALAESHNKLSQINVLQQIEHIKSYPFVQERIASGKLRVHAWWFDIARADVYAYEEDLGKFTLIDEEEGRKILARIEKDGR